jgi:hypothetical protein
MLNEPVAGVLVRRGELEVVTVEGGEAARAEPSVESARREAALEFGEHAIPQRVEHF